MELLSGKEFAVVLGRELGVTVFPKKLLGEITCLVANRGNVKISGLYFPNKSLGLYVESENINIESPVLEEIKTAVNKVLHTVESPEINVLNESNMDSAIWFEKVGSIKLFWRTPMLKSSTE